MQRAVLDEQMAASRRLDPRPWGIGPWLGPLLIMAGTAAVLVVVSLMVLGEPDSGLSMTAALLSVAAQVALLIALVPFARQIAARGGGWRTGLGLDRIRRSDWLPWVLGVALVFLGRLVVGVVLVALAGSQDAAVTGNLQGVAVDQPRLGPLSVFALAVVVLAPIAEEVLFRGLLLRTFMRRLRFWPAALLSTALFAAFHLYQAPTVFAAVAVFASISVLGLGACYLVRVTGRLTPGMLVHATLNAVALLFAVLLSS
jgi:membrane protease YdiL (CAAX protease family)